MLAGLALVLRSYLRDVASAGAYVDALARGEDAAFPALDHPGAVPELAVAITHLKSSWETRRKALEALVSAHETVLDRLPDPLLRLDADRNVIRANAAAKALLGQSLGSRGEVALDRAGELRGAKAARGADRQGDKKVPHGTQNLFSQLRVHWMGLQVQEKYNTQPSM